MRLSLSEHKLPIGVTGVGLLVAAGLAVAPVLMADSATDILSNKNASDIQSLTSQLQQQSENLDQRFESQSAGLSGQLDNLDAQVVILNKAVKNMFLRSQRQKQSTEAALNELSTGPRLTNIEKAVTNLHRKQRNAEDSFSASIQNYSDEAELRLQNLEKAVKRLHLRQHQAATAPAAVASPEQDSKTESRLESIEREYRAMFGRVASLENTVRLLSSVTNNPEEPTGVATNAVTTNGNTTSATANTAQPAGTQSAGADRIEELEMMVAQLLERQQRSASPRSVERSFARENMDPGTANRIKRLERVISRMERRINSIESSGNGQEDMVDQLYEIQDYIDQVLDQINR